MNTLHSKFYIVTVNINYLYLLLLIVQCKKKKKLNKTNRFKNRITLIICNITVLAETYKYTFPIGTKANTKMASTIFFFNKHNIYYLAIDRFLSFFLICNDHKNS